MHTSKCGNCAFMTSPRITCNLFSSSFPCTRFVNSAAILGSISTACNWRTPFSRIFIVRFPVPGPTSRTTSVGLRLALSTIACATPGFLRMCWPRSVFILKTLLVREPAAALPFAYGVWEGVVPFGFWAFGMVG